MTTRRKVVVIVLAIVAFLVLFMVAQRSVSPASASGGPHIGTALTCFGHGAKHKCCKHGIHYGPKGHKRCNKHHRHGGKGRVGAERISKHHQHVLARAVGAFLAGDLKRVKRILRRGFGGKGWQMRVPISHGSRKRVALKPGATYRKGCGTAYVDGKYETSFVGFDVLKASMKQTWCWKRGKITRVGDLKVFQHVTQWGAVMNWREDHVRKGSHGWTNYGNHKHGGHYANATAAFEACAPVPTGCILPTHKRIRMSLLLHGDGQSFTNVGY
jgi:hypothetical protein